eukprot:TRINITY_DN61164_c0_g1_i1.p2 TRINITY_DN61164_c0_g1~~TRINITY_DN61164_c0_g1_i1.p2  ORF type:complete len:107 (+),score=19.86 TRINITY_DN61164_c0_g1_i1:471-791(+)
MSIGWISLLEHFSVVIRISLHDSDVVLVLYTFQLAGESGEAYGKDESNQRREAERNPPMLAGDDGWVLEKNRQEYNSLEENISDDQLYRRCFIISDFFVLFFFKGS